jgi:hypothetical protein
MPPPPADHDDDRPRRPERVAHDAVIVGDLDDFAFGGEETTDPELALPVEAIVATVVDPNSAPQAPPAVPEALVEAPAPVPAPLVEAPAPVPAPLSPALFALPDAHARRPSRHDMQAMLQEFSVMVRLDRGSKRRRQRVALALAVLALVVVAVLAVRWWSARPAPAAAGPAAELPAPLHADAVDYLLVDPASDPPQTSRRSISSLAARLAGAALRASGRRPAQGVGGKAQ